ncbi:MAG: aminotransferase class V-fold PLP-dependent enzyme [Ignisphaera sp.]
MEMKFLTPGPVQLPKKVIEAIAKQPEFHRIDEFRKTLRRVLDNLAKVYKGTSIIAPGTGTFAVDTAIYNYIDPGEEVVAIVHGEFGERMSESARSRGAKVYELRYRIHPPSPDVVEDFAKKLKNIRAITVVHNETSVGVTNRYLDKLQKIAEGLGAILIVDSVSALPAEPIRHRIDVVATATQKAFMAPPGGAIIYINVEPRAKSPLPPSMNLRKFIERLDKADPPYTPPINVIYGLDAALEIILSMGVETYHELHKQKAELLYKSLKLKPVAEEPLRSYTVTAFYADKPTEIINELKKHGYVIAGGMGELKNNTIRIGVMGDISVEDLKKVIEVVNSLVDR